MLYFHAGTRRVPDIGEHKDSCLCHPHQRSREDRVGPELRGKGSLARIIRLRGSTELAEVPRFAGRRSGLALSRPWERPVETCRCGRVRTCRRIIHEDTQFVNNGG